MPLPGFDIDTYAINGLPYPHRLQKTIVFFQSAAYALAYILAIFGWYVGGSVDMGYWSGVITYSAGDRVRTLFGVYESEQGGNINNATTDPAWWRPILSSFIGATERASYTAQKLTFEKALNRYFGTMFRTPTSIDPGVGYLPLSDIYITTDVPAGTSFIMFPGGYPGSSAMYRNSSAPEYMLVPPVYTGATTYSFTIHMPIAVFNALGANDPIRTSIVQKFADKLNLIGCVYSIATY